MTHNRTRKISNPHIPADPVGTRVKFKINTLLFFSTGYSLGNIDSSNIRTKEVPAGAKINVEKTLFRKEDNTYVSRTPNGFWFEWTDDEAMLL